MRELIIFTRYPEVGKTKTRLIPVLGAVGAMDLHRRLSEDTVNKFRDLEGVSRVIYYTGGDREKMAIWLGEGLDYRLQVGDDLGDRMERAFREGFDRGADSIIIIGTDCPGLTIDIVLEGFKGLLDRDLVLGPAEDGGYYLIGLSRPYPELFRGIDWGTSTVLESTRKIALSLGATIEYLPVLRDIDRPEDLNRMFNDRPRF